jgi:hypothetical protein
VPVSFSAHSASPDGRLWLANQAGALFSLQAGSSPTSPLHAVPGKPLPPVAGLLALDGQRLLALTLRGATVVPMAGDRP